MKKSIFQEKNLVRPEVIFNQIGNEKFGKEWTNLPLKVLGSRHNTFKISDERYERKKFMARQVWRALNKYLKAPNVTVYVDTATWDEDLEDADPVEWGRPFRLSLCSDLLLIEKGARKNGKLIKREFWIEVPKEKNILSFKKVGTKPKHNLDYLKSILPEVRKLVRGRVTERSLADAYKDYLKHKPIKAPSKTWIGQNLDTELQRIREEQ